MAVFNECRKILTDASKEEQRESIAEKSGFFKRLYGLSMGLNSVTSAVGLLAIKSFPRFGALVTLSSTMGYLTSREVMVVCGNTQNILKNRADRMAAAQSEMKFTQHLTKGTFIIGPLFAQTTPRIYPSSRV